MSIDQSNEDGLSGDVLHAMEEFSARLSQVLGENLLSVVLFGSAVLGDFRPGVGDIDFMAVTRAGLTGSECDAIFALHDTMRRGEMGPLAVQIEGTYYPLALAIDPTNVVASGCYVGTSRRGWKQVDRNRNSLADYSIIRSHGVTCWGDDVSKIIYNPTGQEILDEIARGLDANIDAVNQHRNDAEYALAMFHWAPRVLCYTITREFVSKSSAADWYVGEFPDTCWTRLVGHAKGFRRYPLGPEDRAALDPMILTNVQGFLLHIRELFMRATDK